MMKTKVETLLGHIKTYYTRAKKFGYPFYSCCGCGCPWGEYGDGICGKCGSDTMKVSTPAELPILPWMKMELHGILFPETAIAEAEKQEGNHE